MTADCCLPAKRAVLTENLKDEVSPCVIEVTSSVDFQVGIFFHVKLLPCLERQHFFFSMNSFHTILFSKPRRFTLMKSKMTMNYEVMLISDFNVDEIKSYP